MGSLSADLEAKRDRLLACLRSCGSCAVAYSGGVDSSLLAKAAFLALGNQAVAVTGYSESLSREELHTARRIAQLIGIRHEIVATEELSLPEYCANGPKRCFYCKQELFRRIEELARKLGLAVIVEGSNGDDRHDYRPGLQALREKNVRSPFIECNLNKVEIRCLAEHWGLPNHDQPATPCLSSRVAYGVRITPQLLAKIHAAECFLKERGFRSVRVRFHGDELVRIEVEASQIARLTDETLRRETIDYFHALGFKYVSLDLQGYCSGSMNKMLKVQASDPD